MAVAVCDSGYRVSRKWICRGLVHAAVAVAVAWSGVGLGVRIRIRELSKEDQSDLLQSIGLGKD